MDPSGLKIFDQNKPLHAFKGDYNEFSARKNSFFGMDSLGRGLQKRISQATPGYIVGVVSENSGPPENIFI